MKQKAVRIIMKQTFDSFVSPLWPVSLMSRTPYLGKEIQTHALDRSLI